MVLFLILLQLTAEIVVDRYIRSLDIQNKSEPVKRVLNCQVHLRV